MSLKNEIAAYEEMRADVEAEHLGKWALVHNEKLTGTFESLEQAAETAVEQFGRGPYLIRKIGEAPVTLPASILYRPAPQHASG